jgi:hypothetical protein
MKFFVVALCAALVGGCAIDPKALTGAGAGATSVLGFYSTSADLRQQLALETIKESAQLEYLSNFSRTCRDNPGYMFPRDFRSAQNIKAATIAKLNKSDQDYIFLVEYSKAFDKIVKQYGDVQLDITNAAAIAKGVGKYSAETAALSEIAVLISTAAIAVTEEIKFAKLRAAARKYQPLLEEHAKSLSGRLSGLDRQTTQDIAIWRDCVQEKFKIIATLAKPNILPTSVIELDAAYGAFQAQYRSYVGTSPQVGDMIKDLVDANKAIVDAPDSTRIKESIERYITIFDNSRSTISKAGALPI